MDPPASTVAAETEGSHESHVAHHRRERVEWVRLTCSSAMPPHGGWPGALRLYCRKRAKSFISMKKGPPDPCFKLDGNDGAKNPAKGSQSFLREKLNIEPRADAPAIELNVTAIRAWAEKNGRTEFLFEHNPAEGIPPYADPGNA